MGRSRLFNDDERKERHRISNLAYVKRKQEEARVIRESLPKPTVEEVLAKKAQQCERKNARRRAL